MIAVPLEHNKRIFIVSQLVSEVGSAWSEGKLLGLEAGKLGFKVIK